MTQNHALHLTMPESWWRCLHDNLKPMSAWVGVTASEVQFWEVIDTVCTAINTQFPEDA